MLEDIISSSKKGTYDYAYRKDLDDSEQKSELRRK
jgi:hypothetical protein